MGAMRFTDLRAWQASIELTAEVYDLTGVFPPREIYGLTAQVRRAAASIGANIAEGFGRWSPRDQARYYEIAKSSTEEVRHFLFLAVRLGFMKPDPALHGRIDALCGMLYNLRQVVLSKPSPPK